jgi:23S rRNA (uridine2552-2'-O)-methyltransferase
MATKRIVEIQRFRYVGNVKRDKIHDFYFHKAKKEKFSARSVYKLQNIQDKYHLFAAGNKVLDLGAAPGSWTEYLVSILGKKGMLIALDEQPLSITALAKLKKSELRFEFLRQSVFDPLPDNLPKFDGVVSDMAPFTQGNRTVDTSKSLELIERAFQIATKHLKQGGHFVVKLFHSEDTVKASRSWQRHFKFAKLYKPPAVQKESKEIYFIGQNFKLNLESTHEKADEEN